jgi:hypothetical protein
MNFLGDMHTDTEERWHLTATVSPKIQANTKKCKHVHWILNLLNIEQNWIKFSIYTKVIIIIISFSCRQLMKYKTKQTPNELKIWVFNWKEFCVLFLITQVLSLQDDDIRTLFRLIYKKSFRAHSWQRPSIKSTFLYCNFVERAGTRWNHFFT